MIVYHSVQSNTKKALDRAESLHSGVACWKVDGERSCKAYATKARQCDCPGVHSTPGTRVALLCSLQPTLLRFGEVITTSRVQPLKADQHLASHRQHCYGIPRI